MVDWSLARQVARLAAGSGEPPGEDPDIAVAWAEMVGKVAAYTRLQPASAVPDPELVSRAEWASVNLDSLAGLLDPVAERLERGGGVARPRWGGPGEGGCPRRGGRPPR